MDDRREKIIINHEKLECARSVDEPQTQQQGAALRQRKHTYCAPPINQNELGNVPENQLSQVFKYSSAVIPLNSALGKGPDR